MYAAKAAGRVDVECRCRMSISSIIGWCADGLVQVSALSIGSRGEADTDLASDHTTLRFGADWPMVTVL